MKMSNQAPRSTRRRATSGASRTRYCAGVDSVIDVARVDVGAVFDQVAGDVDIASAVQRGLAGAAAAGTSDGSASTSSRTRSNIPRFAAAKMSTMAPRAMRGARLNGVMSYSSRPKGPGFQSLFRLTIRAVFEKHVERVEVLLDARHGAGSERVRDRLIHRRPHVGMRLQQLAHATRHRSAARRGTVRAASSSASESAPQVGPALKP